MHISAKADYALRAMAVLARAEQPPVKGEEIAESQGIPQKFLENIMLELKRADLVLAQRGVSGGYRLALSPEEITLADIFRAVEGPLVKVQGLRPESATYTGAAEPLQDVWIAVRASIRLVLESVTLADIRSGSLPPEIQEMTQDPDAWVRH